MLSIDWVDHLNSDSLHCDNVKINLLCSGVYPFFQINLSSVVRDSNLDSEDNSYHFENSLPDRTTYTEHEAAPVRTFEYTQPHTHTQIPFTIDHSPQE